MATQSLRFLFMALLVAVVAAAFLVTGGAAAATLNLQASGEVSGANYTSVSFNGSLVDGTAAGVASFTGYAGETLEVQTTCIRVGPEGTGTFAIVTGPVISGPLLGQQVVFGLIDYGDASLDRISGVFPVSGGADCTNTGLAVQATFTSGTGVAITSPPPPPPLPTSMDECKEGGWERFGRFANQGDCVAFVATNGTNESKG
jgi:hypothetical protein